MDIAQKIIIILGFFLVMSGCIEKPDRDQLSETDALQQYNSSITEWKEKRINSLKKNWLSLSGLFPLNEGENTFGASPNNDIVFPGKDIPDIIGSFFLQNGTVSVRIHPGVEVWTDSTKVNTMNLVNDAEGEPTIMQTATLHWYVIKRVDKLYIRLRDTDNPKIESFEGIESYPLDISWKIRGQYEPHLSPKIIETTTSSGDPSRLTSTGAVGFRIDDQYFRLDVWPIGDSDRYQTIFSDKTSGDETYGAGRFLVIEKIMEEGITGYIVDFNKAYNPPCAFTEYATCPLPPPQNRLPVSITAGEKKYTGGGH